jgi:hypothetical protein
MAAGTVQPERKDVHPCHCRCFDKMTNDEWHRDALELFTRHPSFDFQNEDEAGLKLRNWSWGDILLAFVGA